MTIAASPIVILLVEDDVGDVVLTREAFERTKLANPLHVVNDGTNALRFLRRQPPYQYVPRPGLVLLDLNLPRMDGRAVLAELRADPELRDIPVAVLTASAAEEDIVRSFGLRANAYIIKPVDFDRIVEVVRQLDDLGLSVVRSVAAV